MTTEIDINKAEVEYEIAEPHVTYVSPKMFVKMGGQIDIQDAPMDSLATDDLRPEVVMVIRPHDDVDGMLRAERVARLRERMSGEHTVSLSDAPSAIRAPLSRPRSTAREEGRRRKQRERQEQKAIETAERLEKEQQSLSNAAARTIVWSQRKAAERGARIDARMKQWEHLFDNGPDLLSRSDPRNGPRIDRAIAEMNEQADRENGIDDEC